MRLAEIYRFPAWQCPLWPEQSRKIRRRRTAWPLGVLMLDNAYITGAFTENDLAIVSTLVQQTALTLENARLYQASKQRSSQLQALTGASTQITTSLQKEALIDSLLDQLQTILPSDTGTLWLRQNEPATRTGQSGPDRMLIRSARGFADSDERIGLIIDVQDSQLIDEMIRTSKPIWVPDISQDPRFKTLSLEGELAAALEAEMPAPATGYERLSWLGVPIDLLRTGDRCDRPGKNRAGFLQRGRHPGSLDFCGPVGGRAGKRRAIPGEREARAGAGPTLTDLEHIEPPI